MISKKLVISYKIFYLIVLGLILTSCTHFSSDESLDSYGSIYFYNSINSKSFSFAVKEEFTKHNTNKASYENFPAMNVGEYDLLRKLLKKSGYCSSKNGKPSFMVTSKQEKIYDTTFASVVHKGYNIKPVTPLIYFGKCL